MTRVAIIQHHCEPDPETNLQTSIDGIRQATADGAQLILLPELHRTPYFCQRQDSANFDLAETIPGPTSDRLGELAAELGVVIVASVFEKRSVGVWHNSAVVIESDGRIAGVYRKMHIPDDPGFHEKFYFTPGDQGYQPISTSVGRLGVMVCWDQWYPEAARLMTLAQADILIYPSAIGWDPNDDLNEQSRQRDAWVTVMRGHAIANGIPVMASNRVGHEADPSGQSSGIDFWGHSFVVGPQGEFLAQAGTEAEILVSDLDPERPEAVRRIWPFLRDRRIDSYADLTRRCIDTDDSA